MHSFITLTTSWLFLQQSGKQQNHVWTFDPKEPIVPSIFNLVLVAVLETAPLFVLQAHREWMLGDMLTWKSLTRCWSFLLVCKEQNRPWKQTNNYDNWKYTLTRNIFWNSSKLWAFKEHQQVEGNIKMLWCICRKKFLEPPVYFQALDICFSNWINCVTQLLKNQDEA